MTLLKTLVAQMLGLVVAVGLTRTLPTLLHGTGELLFIQSIAAAIGSRILRQPPWWLVIHLLFLPTAVALLSIQVPALWYLLIVLLLTLIFWGTIKGDVPLFLSSSAVADTMIDIVSQEHAQSFAELGAGIGSVTIPLAKRHPGLNIDAWERAPLPWAINAWRCHKLPDMKLYRASFWTCDFGYYDVVFVFLSPAVMPELGARVRLSMRPGSLFISSSFPVPDWEPEFIRQLNDRPKTQLFCYRVGSFID
jgi:hypothetical protein